MHSKTKALRTWRHHKGEVYGVLAALAFTAYVLINRYVYLHYQVDTFLYTTTFLIAGSLFAVLSLAVEQTKTNLKLIDKSTLPLAVYGMIAGAGLGLMVFGQAFTTAINTSIIATAVVLTTAFFSWLVLKERFNRTQMAWLPVMFVGLYVAITGGRLISFNKGDLIILGAICLMGFTNALSKIFMKKNSSSFVADVRLVSGAVPFVMLGLVTSGKDFLVTSAGWWPLLAGLLFFLTTKFFYEAVHITNPNEAIVLFSIHPFFAALFGVLLLSESYSWIKFLGSVVVLTSVYFITKKSRRSPVKLSTELP